MPSPYGKEPRPNRFLLRLTDRENAFIRKRAATDRVAINDALSMIIDDAMQRERYDELMDARKEAEEAAAKKKAAAPPKKHTPPRKGTAPAFGFSDLDPHPGQTDDEP